MADPVEIAEKLTEAQRRAMLAAEPRRVGEEELFLPSYRDGGKLVQSIYDLNLVTIVMRGVMLNSFGLAVRQHLKDQQQ